MRNIMSLWPAKMGIIGKIINNFWDSVDSFTCILLRGNRGNVEQYTGKGSNNSTINDLVNNFLEKWY